MLWGSDYENPFSKLINSKIKLLESLMMFPHPTLCFFRSIEISRYCSNVHIYLCMIVFVAISRVIFSILLVSEQDNHSTQDASLQYLFLHAIANIKKFCLFKVRNIILLFL